MAAAGWDFLQKKTLFVLVSKRCFKGPYIIFFVLEEKKRDFEEKGPKKKQKKETKKKGVKIFSFFFSFLEEEGRKCFCD